MSIEALLEIANRVVPVLMTGYFAFRWGAMRAVRKLALDVPPPLPGAGPYRMPAEVVEAIQVGYAGPFDDTIAAIADATANLNEKLRTGKIDAYHYQEEIEWLAVATRKANELRERVGKKQHGS